MFKRNHVAALFVMSLLIGCSGGSSGTSATPVTPNIQVTESATITSQELTLKTDLHAQPHQTLILSMKGAATGTALTQGNPTHRIPYYLTKDVLINYTLETKNACIAEIKVDDTAGNNQMTINLSTPTTETFLTSGTYVVTVTEVSPLPDHCSHVFINSPQARNKSAGKSVALAAPADTTTDPTLFNDNVWRLFGGRDAVTGTWYFHDADHYGINRFSGTISGLWSDYNTTAYNTFGLIRRGFTEDCSDFSCGATVNTSDAGIKPFNLTNPANSGWMLKTTIITGYPNATSKIMPFGCYLDNTTPDLTNLQYLQYPDTSRPGAIFAFIVPAPTTQSVPDGCYAQEGSVGHSTPYRFKLTQGNSPNDFNFTISGQGKTTGFTVTTGTPSAARDHVALGIVSAANTGTVHQDASLPMHEVLRQHLVASSITPSSGEVVLYSKPNYTGPALVFNADTDYAKFPINFRFTIGSIKLPAKGGVNPDSTYIRFGTPGNYQYINRDLADATGMGLSLNQAKNNYFRTNFSVFKAINVIISSSCPGCNLEDAQLSGRTLDNRDFTGANFIDADLSGASLQSCTMKGADLRGANLINANLQGINLNGAFLNKSPNASSKAATLTGAYMRGANLAYADLTGAQLDYVSFHSLFTNSCIPDKNGTITTGCSSAYRATLTGANLTGAYIPGLDLSGAILSRVNFTGAFAMGANFSGSSVNTDTSGSSTTFSQTVLLGAVFDNATLQGATFYNAYLSDPNRPPEAGSANAVVYLSDKYTGYKGSTYSGKAVCTQYAIAMNTKPPFTDATNICPNGTNGPCTQWVPGLPFSSLIAQIVLNYTAAITAPASCAGAINMFW